MKRSLTCLCFIVSIFLPALLVAEEYIEPVLLDEISELMDANQKSTLKISLKVGKVAVVAPEEKTPEPAASAADKAAGFIAFKRHYLDLIYYNTNPKPAEVNPSSFDVAVTPGSYEIVSVGLYPLENVDAAVSVSDLKCDAGTLSKAAVDIQTVKYLLKSVEGGLAKVMPELIFPENPVHLKKTITRQLWITLHPPKGTKPGVYKGNITVAGKGKAPVVLPFNVEVYPFELLADQGVSFGWFCSPIMEEKKMLDYFEHGCNSVYLPGPWVQKIENGKPVINWDNANKNLAMAKKLGIKTRCVMGVDGSGVRELMRDKDPEGAEVAAAGLAVFQESWDWVKKSGMDIVVQVFDEPREIPAEHRTLKDAMYWGKIAKKVPGIILWIDPMGDKYGKTDYAPLTEVYDVFCPHLDPGCKNFLTYGRNNPGKGWAYNCGRSRITFGFMVEKWQLHGRFEWAYDCGWAANAYNPSTWSSIRAGDPYAGIYYPVKGGGFVSSPYYDMTREGIDDYKYCYTLRQAIKAADAKGTPEAKAAAGKAQSVLDNIISKVPAHTTGSDLTIANITADDAAQDGWRAQIAREIINLSKIK